MPSAVARKDDLHHTQKGNKISLIQNGEPYIRVSNKGEVYQFLSTHRYSSDEVKQIRRKCGLSQKAFSEAMGMSVRTVQAWERDINTPGGSSARLLDLVNYDYGFASMMDRELVEYDGEEVLHLRGRCGLPRELFALVIGVSNDAVASWEQDRCKPNGAASRLLDLLKDDEVLGLLMEKE